MANIILEESGVKTSLRRHLEKDGDKLTEEGIQNALYAGLDFAKGKKSFLIKAYSSQAYRAFESATLFLAGARYVFFRKGKSLPLLELPQKVSDYNTITDRFNSEQMEKLKEIKKENPEESALVEAIFNEFPETMAENARRVGERLGNTLYDFDVEPGTFNIIYSHSPVVESVQQFLKGQEQTYRGMLKSGEGFNLTAIKDVVLLKSVLRIDSPIPKESGHVHKMKQKDFYEMVMDTKK